MPDSTAPEPVLVAVIGSRSFNNYPQLCRELDELAQTVPIAGIVSGGARGADELGRRYANDRGLVFREFLPEYSRYGRRAPLVRNELIIKEIADKGGVVISFWDGLSAGTRYALTLARKLGVRTIIVVPEQPS